MVTEVGLPYPISPNLVPGFRVPPTTPCILMLLGGPRPGSAFLLGMEGGVEGGGGSNPGFPSQRQHLWPFKKYTVHHTNNHFSPLCLHAHFADEEIIVNSFRSKN